jgi:predicted PolB exonuclease-like 3'-5' exonuclease
MAILVVFDIEAVPDFEAARRLLAKPDSTPDAEIRRMLGERYSPDNEDPTTTFLKVPIYRIVSIATLNAKRDDGGGPWTVSQIGSRSVSRRRRPTYC